MNTSGLEAGGRLVYVYNGTRIYILVFVSRSDSGKGQGQVLKILDSVIFKK